MKVRPEQRRRRGYAFMVVIIQLTLLTALWGVAYRQLSSTIRFTESLSQKYVDEKGSLSDVGLKPLTRALILLETGDPPYDGYSCGVTVTGPKGKAIGFVVTFTRDDGLPDGNRWKVQSYSVDDLNSFQLPTMPYSFR